MTHELILILGGARSGKSTYAQQMALERGGSGVLYVATAQAHDEEMSERIAVHQAERHPGWRTLEAPLTPGSAIREAAAGSNVIVVDCITLLVTNAMLATGEEPATAEAERAALAEVDGLLEAYAALDATWVVVSNEVGLGLVPPYPLGRAYRDALGRANQRLAAAADHVLFMVAGLPLRLK